MSEKIVKNIITREISSATWGQISNLIDEDNFSIQEFTVNPKDKIKILLNEESVYFILVSGSAEFKFENENKLLFKGEKIDFLVKDKSLDTTITNCGVIPLVFIKIGLK